MNLGRLKSWAVLDQRRQALVLTIVTGLVIVSLAFGLAGLTWRLAGLNDGRDRVALAVEPPASARSGDITPILALAPFGGVVADAQASAAGMTLKAIFMAVPADASSALIAVGDAPATVAYPGQTLSTGAVVHSIAVDHVVLQVNGQAERLEFPKPADGSGGQPATPGTGQTSAPPSPQAGTAATAVPTAATDRGMNPVVVEQYRQRLAGNPQALASEMNLTATAAGYRVGENPPPPLRAAGLQPGDVVERVNNQPVGTLGNARSVLDQAILSGGARVEVLRNGRRITLSFPLR